MANIKERINYLKERFLALPTGQKVILIVSPIVFIGIITALLLIATKPNYSVLYTGLSQEDMSAVMTELDKKGIDYKIGPDGKTILVPEDKVRDIRLELAAKGVPSKGIVGYELFDKTSIGVSDFQNQVNFKRAVEGELARTIMRIAGVEDAKVNIGMPEKSIFLREEEEPSASVFIKLKPGYELTPEQVRAIRNLVSASVPRLKPNRVVVIDHMGRDLTAMLEEREEYIGARELKLKLEFEKRLERDIQRALEEVVGYGNVRVKVYADLDFTRREQKEEIYDPEMTAIVSQQKKKERTLGGGVGGVPGVQANIPPGQGAVAGGGQVITEKSETITNYEVSKKEVYTSDPLIKIKRLSVGIVVDSNVKNIDVEKIKRVASAAAGIDPQRGDVLTVEAIPFNRPLAEKPLPDYERYIKLALLAFLVVLIAIISLIVLRKAIKRKEEGLIPTVPAPTPPTTEVLKEAEKIRFEAEKLEVIEVIAKTAKEEPEKVSKIIRSWLRSKT